MGELIDISQDIFNSVSTKVGNSLANAGSGLQNDENHPNKSGKNFVDKYLDKALDHNRNAVDTQHRNTIHTKEPKHVSINDQEPHPVPIHGQEPHRVSIHDQEPHLVSSPLDDPRHQGLLNTGDSIHPKAIPGGFPTTKSFEGQSALDQLPHHTQEHGALGQKPLHNNEQGTFGQQDRHHEHGVLDSQQTSSPVTHIDPLQQRGDTPIDQSTVGTKTNYQQKIENHRLYQSARNEMYEHKDHAHATIKENVPKEKQDELLSRLQVAIAQIQKHPEYQVAIQTLIQLIKVWSTRLTQVTEGVKTHAKEGDHPQQDNFREQSEHELKSIIECWAQGYSIDPLLHGVQKVMRDMQNDEQLREFYQNVMQYVDKLVTEPGYVQREQSTQEGRHLMDRGNQMIKGRYRENLHVLSLESRKMMNLMAEDDISKELNHRIATIHRDLWMDG